MGFITGLFVVCAACTLAVIALDSLSEIEEKDEIRWRVIIGNLSTLGKNI